VGCDFTKAGSGTFAMNTLNLYTGRTYIAGGTLKVPSEDSLGVSPSGYVADRIIFDGGGLRTESNMTWEVSNRGMYRRRAAARCGAAPARRS
jgi:autotransporter-associated beta strand protein